MELKRRFVQVDGRRVHYFRAGDGPPVVLVHSSPANARLLMKEIERLAEDYTVFAPDTPGFGLSDALPGAELAVAGLADALADTLRAMAMPRCPMFGTHTGAAIALEFGVRHPDRVTGLVLDGVPAFTDAECTEFFGSYFQKMPPSELGGQYAEAWTRFRDQSIWFPWTNRTPANHNPYDLSPPHSTHLWVAMFFEAAEHYAPAYRAASYYGSRAIAAAAALTVTAVYCATETDMLHSHLERLPPMKPGQAIVDIGSSHERKRELIAASFRQFGADGAAPADPDAIASTPGIARQFVDARHGQLHLRTAGDRRNRPLLLLHDAPGSAEQAEPLIERLATRFFVIAPDLPGCGESDALAGSRDIAAFARTAVDLLDELAIADTAVYGVGIGSSVALALAHDHPDRVSALALQGAMLPEPAERARLHADLAPPIAIVADGGHWYRTWLMLRDSQVYWPWFDRTLAALRRVPADFSARPLHRWTMDVMRAHDSYGEVVHAALDHDAAAALAVVTTRAAPVIHVVQPATPLSVYDDRLAALSAGRPMLAGDAPDFVDRLAMTFDHSMGTNRVYSRNCG